MNKGFIDPDGNIITIGNTLHLVWWRSRFPDLEFLSGGWVRWRIHPEDRCLEIEFVGSHDEDALIKKISKFTAFKPEHCEIIREKT